MRTSHVLIIVGTALLTALLVLTVSLTVGTALVGGPCEQEDSRWCHWDATDRGNGQGRSFVDVGGVTIYVP